MLKSRRTFPPGGWQFFEPKTGWPKSQNEFAGLDFDQVAAAIVKHRLGNPRHRQFWSTIKADVEDELDEYTCVRIARDPNYCTGGPPESFPVGSVNPPPSSTLQNLKSLTVAVAKQAAETIGGAITEGKKVVAGIGLFKDWVGDVLAPVDKELAEQRSRLCADCPQNKPGGLTAFFTVPASEMIKKQIAMKNDLALDTSNDEKLGVCQACACPLKLKVWTPLAHIVKFLLPQAKAALDDRCWIIKE